MNRQQCLASLQAFLPDDKEIIRIINACDLDPIDETNSGWRGWQNQYSPYIKVQKNKKLVTRWKGENFFVPKKDLYAYSSAQDVARISKTLLFIADGDCFCFLFMGKDDKLRYRRYIKGMYLNDPPLHVPIDDIRTLIKNENIDGYKSVQLTKTPGPKGWVTSWPSKSDFYQELKKETKICNSPAESLILENIVAEDDMKIIFSKQKR